MKLLTLKQAIKHTSSRARNPHNYQYYPDRFARTLAGSNVLQRTKPNPLRTLFQIIVRTIKWHLK